MSAPRSARALCLLGGLLCALGILSGAALRPAMSAHHRSAHPAVAITLADAHGHSTRWDDQPAVATAGPGAQSLTARTASPSDAPEQPAADRLTARTRGPPS